MKKITSDKYSKLCFQRRNDAHDNIFKILKKYKDEKNADLHVFREPLTYLRNKKVKAVVVVSSLEQAEAIISEINDEICSTNDYIYNLSQDTGNKMTPISYKISTFKTTSTHILTSVSPARSQTTLTGADLLKKCDKHLSSTFKYKDPTADEDFLKIKKMITDEIINTADNYYFEKKTGYSYRISYFCPETKKKIQISVKDIIFLISEQKIVFSENTQKKRTDIIPKEEYLFYGTTCFVREKEKREE